MNYGNAITLEAERPPLKLLRNGTFSTCSTHVEEELKITKTLLIQMQSFFFNLKLEVSSIRWSYFYFIWMNSEGAVLSTR